MRFYNQGGQGDAERGPFLLIRLGLEYAAPARAAKEKAAVKKVRVPW